MVTGRAKEIEIKAVLTVRSGAGPAMNAPAQAARHEQDQAGESQ